MAVVGTIVAVGVAARWVGVGVAAPGCDVGGIPGVTRGTPCLVGVGTEPVGAGVPTPGVALFVACGDTVFEGWGVGVPVGTVRAVGCT